MVKALLSGVTSPDTPEAFDFNRALGAGYEEMGVVVWEALFPRIEDARAKLHGEYVAVVEPRSSLALDDPYLGAWRAGGLHVGAMSAALDSLMTIQRILEVRELPMTALYPMLRAAIENASVAIYLLQPEDRDERLRRSFFVADDDAKWRSSFETSFGNPDAQTRRHNTRAEIRTLVSGRPGLGDPETFSFSMPTYSDLVANAGAVIAADPAMDSESTMSLLAWWQLLSGLSHAKQWAMFEALQRSEAIVDEENETAHVKMTSFPAAIALALLRAVETLEAALRLYGRRSKAAWAVPEDATEPPTLTYSQRREAQGND